MQSKIRKAFAGIVQLIRNPYLLNHVLDEETYWRSRVVRKHGFADGLPVIDIADLFPVFEQRVSPYAFLDGSCTPLDLALLRALAEAYGVDDYLEIGTWRGESVANVAPFVKQAVSINLPDEEMRAMGMDEAYIGLHRFFSRNLANVNHLQANSLRFDFGTLGRKFDMVFVDGDHHYEAVRSDSSRVAGILKESGVLVWHDYARNPEQVRWSVLAGILDGLPVDMHRHLYHISNTLCAVYLPALPAHVKPVRLQAHEQPGKFFEIRIGIKKMKNEE